MIDNACNNNAVFNDRGKRVRRRGPGFCGAHSWHVLSDKFRFAERVSASAHRISTQACTAYNTLPFYIKLKHPLIIPFISQNPEDSVYVSLDGLSFYVYFILQVLQLILLMQQLQRHSFHKIKIQQASALTLLVGRQEGHPACKQETQLSLTTCATYLCNMQ